MDRATTKWRITRQDKTRYDNIGELRVLLIHQLVLVCWSLFPRPSPFITLNHPILRCRDVVALQHCCNAARSALLHAVKLLGLQCYMLQHLQHYQSLLLCCRILGHDNFFVIFSPSFPSPFLWLCFFSFPSHTHCGFHHEN